MLREAAAGITTVQRAPSARQADATPCAWFPAETAMTPRVRAASSRRLTAFTAPRTLNEPVFWSDSHFSENALAPQRPASVCERSIGVAWRCPAMRDWAA